MGKYTGTRVSITPATTDDNFAIDAASGEYAKIRMFNWGGEASSSTPMATRWGRSSGGLTPTTGSAEKGHPGSQAAMCDFVTAWATDPTIDDILWAQGWNAFGGGGIWQDPDGFDIVGASHFSCRNSTGTGTSTYSVVWSEP